MKIGLHTAFPQTAKKWLGINNLNVIQIQQRTGNRNNRKYHQTRWLFRESLFEMWRTNGMLKKNENIQVDEKSNQMIRIENLKEHGVKIED